MGGFAIAVLRVWVVGISRSGVSIVQSQVSPPPIRANSRIEASERVACTEIRGVHARWAALLII